MDFTIGAVDCIHPEQALRALIVSQERLGYPPAKLFTNSEIKVPSSIDLVRISSLTSGAAVSKWMLATYVQHIDTTHLLNVQADGFVVNPNSWTDQFLEYDYIGAPWMLHPHHHWPPFPDVTPDNRVGNGGFSLRSVRLMEAVNFMFRTELILQQTITDKDYHPEDCYICRTKGPELKAQGFKFAPLWLASQFSVENAQITNQLGFHGKLTMKINPKTTRL